MDAPLSQRTSRRFPPPEGADEDGYLCSGPLLREDVLLEAYGQGIFPWFRSGGLVHWFSPDPRMVLEPSGFHVSGSLRSKLRRSELEVSADRDFAGVIRGCARARGRGRDSSWIDADFVRAYAGLHRSGWAHSIECRRGGRLAGGLYGVSIGACFFGESMFSAERDASKVALAHLCRLAAGWDFELIDCQAPTAHLASLGARAIPRSEFLRRLAAALARPSRRGQWELPGGWSW